MFKQQPGHINMNTGHEIELTAILDLHVPLTNINVRSDRLNTEKPFHEKFKQIN